MPSKADAGCCRLPIYTLRALAREGEASRLTSAAMLTTLRALWPSTALWRSKKATGVRKL